MSYNTCPHCGQPWATHGTACRFDNTGPPPPSSVTFSCTSCAALRAELAEAKREVELAMREIEKSAAARIKAEAEVERDASRALNAKLIRDMDSVLAERDALRESLGAANDNRGRWRDAALREKARADAAETEVERCREVHLGTERGLMEQRDALQARADAAGPHSSERRRRRRKETTMEFIPLYDRLLVQRCEAQKYEGMIEIPDSAKEKPMEGLVLAVGAGRVNDAGNMIAMSVKQGDRILMGKYAGTEIKIDGKELLILREDEVLGIVKGEAAAAFSPDGGSFAMEPTPEHVHVPKPWPVRTTPRGVEQTTDPGEAEKFLESLRKP